MYRLSDEQTALLSEIEKVADERIAPHAAIVDDTGRFPREAFAALADAGLMGLTVPTAFGGKGAEMRTACAALDAIAQRDASTAMVFLMHLCGCACYAAAAQQSGAAKEALSAVAAGKHLSTLAWSEKGSRSHFWAPVSQATESDNGSVTLNAEKSWVTAAGEADGYVVSTRTAGGTEPTDTMLYYVGKDDAGLRVAGAWDSLGMRGNASAPMTLSKVEVGEDRALCEAGQGFPRMMEILPWFALGNAAISIGIAEAATSATQKHLTGAKLEHMGATLADLPNLRARLAQMRIETDRGRAHLSAILDAVENPTDATMLMVLEAKPSASETAVSVTDTAMRACGGAAFSKHLSVERNFRDARAAGVMAPTSDVLYDFIGRALCGMPLF